MDSRKASPGTRWFLSTTWFTARRHSTERIRALLYLWASSLDSQISYQTRLKTLWANSHWHFNPWMTWSTDDLIYGWLDLWISINIDFRSSAWPPNFPSPFTSHRSLGSLWTEWGGTGLTSPDEVQPVTLHRGLTTIHQLNELNISYSNGC